MSLVAVNVEFDVVFEPCEIRRLGKWWWNSCLHSRIWLATRMPLTSSSELSVWTTFAMSETKDLSCSGGAYGAQQDEAGPGIRSHCLCHMKSLQHCQLTSHLHQLSMGQQPLLAKVLRLGLRLLAPLCLTCNPLLAARQVLVRRLERTKLLIERLHRGLASYML